LIIDPLWGVFARILDFSCAGERGDQRCSPPLELAAKPSQTGGMTAASSSDAIDILRIEIEYIEPEAGMIPIVCGGNISPLTTHVEFSVLGRKRLPLVTHNAGWQRQPSDDPNRLTCH
jgi:hypothetical protein